MKIRHPRTAIARGTVAIASSLLVLAITKTGNVPALTQGRTPSYFVIDLPSLGGTISEGRHVDHEGVVTGYSNLAGNTTRRATIWIQRQAHDLGTLGGLNSAVLFTDFPHSGPIVGIAETSMVDHRNEAFSCSEFFPGGRPARTGLVCRGFVFDATTMRPLETLGGTHSFAAGANTKGQVVLGANRIRGPHLRWRRGFPVSACHRGRENG